MIRTRPLISALLAGAVLMAGQSVLSAQARERDGAPDRGRARHEPDRRRDHKIRRDHREERRDARQWDRRDERRDERRWDRREDRRERRQDFRRDRRDDRRDYRRDYRRDRREERREYRHDRRAGFCPPPPGRRDRGDWCDWGPRVLHCAVPRVIMHHDWRLACDWDNWRAPFDAWGDRVCFTVREPVQIGRAEIWCDDGDYRTVDFEGRWFEPGTYVLVDFHGGRRVADVRLQARSRTVHGDFSLFLALGD